MPPSVNDPGRSAPPEGAEAAIGPEVAALALQAVMDPGSRDLLAVIAPEETIEATLEVADAEKVAAFARAQGLTVFAETCDCFEGLTIVVDVGRGVVVSIDAVRR